MHKVESALMAIGRRFIGGFRGRGPTTRASRYMPHQGKQEIARRLRQAQKGSANA